jgi:hypothetical protein
MHRIESSVTSLSWIPREAVEGINKLAFRVGISHYDQPPPEVLEDLQQLLDNDAIRFANELRAWVEVEDGRIIGHGQTGIGRIGRTTLRITPGGMALVFPAVSYPDLNPEPQVGVSSVRFTRTAGGRPGMPTPRHVRKSPTCKWPDPRCGPHSL